LFIFRVTGPNGLDVAVGFFGGFRIRSENRFPRISSHSSSVRRSFLWGRRWLYWLFEVVGLVGLVSSSLVAASSPRGSSSSSSVTGRGPFAILMAPVFVNTRYVPRVCVYPIMRPS